MNILLINYEYKGQGGGAGQQLFYMAKAFSEMGHNVSLLIGWDYRYGNPEIINNVTTHIIKLKRKNIQLSTALGLLYFVFKGLFIINFLTKKYLYDIIQFYFSVPTGILKFGIFGKIPYIVSLRGMDIPGLQKNKYEYLNYLTSLINKNIACNASAVICNSSESAVIYNKFVKNIPIFIISNSVDYKLYFLKEIYSKKITKIVTISRLVSWKKVDLLIDCIVFLKEKYKEISLDIYGQGYLFDTLKKQIINNNAEEYIKLSGYIEKKYILKNLYNYDIFVFLSPGDSCPNVLIEAMSCGLPVLAAKSGGSTDIVIENNTGLFAAPNDFNDTIDKLEYCFNNPEKMIEFGINGRRRVEEDFSIKAASQYHIEIYNNIIKT